MINPFENYRDFTKNILIFQNTGPETPTPDTAESTEGKSEQFDSWFNKDHFKPGTELEVWDVIETHYNPDSFRSIIEAEARKYFPKGESSIDTDALFRRSEGNYRILFAKEKIKFFKSGKEIQARYDEKVKVIRKKTRSELGLIKKSVDLNKDLNNIESKEDGRDKVESYVDFLNDYYLNIDIQKQKWERPGVRNWGIPIVYPLLDKNDAISQYKKYSGYFKKRMSEKVDAKLDVLEGRGKLTPEILKTLQGEIEAEYKKYSGLDKNPGFIDLGDLIMIENLATPNLAALAKIELSKDEADVEMVRAFQLLHPDAWVDMIGNYTDNAMEDVESNGLENKFIDYVNTLLVKEGKREVKSFRKAKRRFKGLMEMYAKADVAMVYNAIDNFNANVNGGRMEAMDAVNIDESRKSLAFHERDRLLTGRLVPEDDGDKKIIKFLNADKRTRENILKDKGRRLALFNAIQRDIQLYPDLLPKRKGKVKSRADLKTNRLDRENPTKRDDVTARFQALIMLANEAKWVVDSFSTNEKFKSLSGELDNIEAKGDVSKAWKFTDTRKNRHTPYRAGISRNGFNGRDLAVKGAKILGILTVIANAANSISQAEGEGVDKFINGLGDFTTNSAAITGATVAFGAHTLEHHSEYYNYMNSSPYGRKRISTTRGLRIMSDKVGKDRVSRFITNEDEWNVMEELNPKQVKSVIKKAKKENPKHPYIKKEYLEGLVDVGTIAKLGKDDIPRAQTRFLFYSRFMTAKKKSNVDQFQEICGKAMESV